MSRVERKRRKAARDPRPVRAKGRKAEAAPRPRAGRHPAEKSAQTLRYRPLDAVFRRREFTDHVNPLPWPVIDDPDAPETDAERYALRRVMATNFFW